MNIFQRIVGFIAILILGWILFYFMYLLLMITICTLGGALFAIIPMLKKLLPWYWNNLMYFVTNNNKYIKKATVQSNSTVQTNDSISQYIVNARTYAAQDDVIRNTLLTEGGWPAEEIQKAFDEANGIQVPKNFNNTH